MRNFLIAGNWKMNCGPEKAVSLLGEIQNLKPAISDSVEVLVCPPFISLPQTSNLLNGDQSQQISLGAQNMHFRDNGAYTGEVSATMLKEVHCRYVIIGHSERREYFGETDITVNYKVIKALQESLKPVICVGETLQQRKNDHHFRIVKKQVQSALNEIEKEQSGNIVIAYEPVWAIGTGETATPEQAQEMHRMIRDTVEELYTTRQADNLQILYGGSMKTHNAQELLEQPDVDGGLIGGASLEAESFVTIIKIAENLSN